MRIRSDSNDDDLPSGRILCAPVLIIVIKSVFQHDNKYSQIHINECVYEL